MSNKLKNFCAFPFGHVMVKPNGDFDICCTHKTPSERKININQQDHKHWIESDYVQNVRKSFLDDERHPNCVLCWQREDQGFDSLRTRGNKEFTVLPDRVDRPIKNVEINLGNLCNLKCLMCNENNSSAILSENIRLGINKITQDNMSWHDTGYVHLQKLLQQKPFVVNIRGGEPLYNKKLLEIVENIPINQARDMVLHITTNATVWNHQWRAALEKFRLVRFMFSVDAVGELYEYIRYPATWTSVEKNIKSIMTLPNVKCLVHCVGQNLNVSEIASLIEWCEQHEIYLEIELLTFPDHLQMINLPPLQKEIALHNLNELKHKSLPDHLSKFICSAHDLIQKTEFEFDRWQTFVNMLTMRDHIRGNTFRKFIKEEQC
jgi:MoaA/NifB/PqqE/SkfB family radical SAM enzyme